MKHTIHGQHNQHNVLREAARADEGTRSGNETPTTLAGVEDSFLVSPEDIRRHAYGKWETAGRPAGDGIGFWLQSETELAAEKKDAWGRGNSQDSDRHNEIRHPHSLKL